MSRLKKYICLLLILSITLLTTAQSQQIKTTALTNLTLIDVEKSESLPNMTVIVQGDKIASIFPNNSEKIDSNVEIIDLTGHFVIPGLIDAHVHLFRPKNRVEILKKLLYSGITSVRDMGGDARMYQKLMQQQKDGNIEGSNIFYSATFFGPTFLKDPRTKFAALGYDPGKAPWMRVITDKTDLKKVISEAKDTGITGIKVYSNIAPELLQKISTEAHLQGLKMWSHASIFPSKPSDASNAKVDVLSHGIGMVFENETNMPLSFNEAIRKSMPLQDFATIDALSPKFISLYKTMQSNGTIFEPTLSAWQRTGPPHKPKNMQAPKANPTAHLSTAAKRLNVPAMNDWVQRITKAAYDNGVTISAGTDFNQKIKWIQDEIKFLTQCGLTNMAALKAATLNNARAIGIESTNGSISVGKQADLVILSQNPLENIDNLRTVVTVYKDGKVYINKKE